MDYNFRIGDMIIPERDPQTTLLILSDEYLYWKAMVITGKYDGHIWYICKPKGGCEKIGNILERNGGKK